MMRIHALWRPLAGLLVGVAGVTALPALEEEWSWDTRAVNEHSLRLDLHYAVTPVHLDDFVELDSSYTVEFGWHYEGLLESRTTFGLVWGLTLQYTAQEGEEDRFEAELWSLGPRVHVGMFYQPWSTLRIGAVPFVGIGGARLDLRGKFEEALPFDDGVAGSVWMEAGVRADAVWQFAETWNVGVSVSYVHADGDFNFSDLNSSGFDVRPVQDYLTVGLTGGWHF